MFKTFVKLTCRNGHLKSLASCQLRHLNIHENQAYTLLKGAGIPTPEFGVAKSPDEAAKIAQELDTKDLVLKAQVLTGGRGKGHFQGSNVSGVVMCETPEEAKELSGKMIGKRLVTKQSGPEGKPCNSVMVTTRMFTRKELYLSVMMERSFDGPVVIASSQGGVNIEEVAESNPDAITYVPVDVRKGLSSEDATKIACSLKVPDVEVVRDIVMNLYDLFVQKEALLLEINPLVIDLCGNYLAIDCKCNFDDSSEFRQKELFALKDWSQQSDAERRAEKLDLNYIPLDGNIACLVNGAGLAMATMDIIKLHGGDPANFLDVGGGATVESVKEAFSIISSDQKVESILVNIFGGIIRCDIIAEGIISAFKDMKFNIPVVARLQGTNAEKGKQLILDAKLKIIPIDDMTEAAKASVEVAEICRKAKELNLDINLTPKAKKPDNKCRS